MITWTPTDSSLPPDSRICLCLSVNGVELARRFDKYPEAWQDTYDGAPYLYWCCIEPLPFVHGLKVRQII